MTFKIAKDNLIVKKIQSKENYDKKATVPNFKVHDKVTLESPFKNQFQPLRNGSIKL